MNHLLEAPLAFLAGLLTIASPCVLPVLPIVLGSAVKGPRTRPLFIVLGFVLSFATLGMMLSLVSNAATDAHEALRNTAIGLLALSGLVKLWPQPYEWVKARIAERLPERSVAAVQPGPGNGGGFVLGMSLGAAWTPCAGPVLASILALIAQAQDPARSAGLLAVYAFGAGMPMLLIAYGGQVVTSRLRWLALRSEGMQQVFGALVLLTAIAIYFHLDVQLYARLLGPSI
jgi:cytochrome c biogenesis protein CcdA